jgi:vitamin B12 transporter
VLTAGLRYDDLDISGTKATYRFGAVCTIPRAGVIIRSSYGTGFRSPALNELFFPFYGNQNLKPEETTSWETGISKDFFEGRVRVSLTYFDQEYENLISTDPLTFTASNIADARVKGFETHLDIQASEHLNITAGYTNLDTEDMQTGKQLPLRPRDKLNIAATVSIKNCTVSADYIFVGERYDSSVKRDLSSYSVLNLSSSLRALHGVTLFLRGENLLGENYEEIGSFGTLGFSLYGGMRVSL